MCVTRILDGLERSAATGPQADAVARMGFLEWAFDAPGAAGPMAAREALESPAAQNPVSPAARAFVGFLEAACVAVPPSPRGRRRRRLH